MWLPVVAVILSQEKTVDRSAEPALRQLFVSASNLTNAHLLVNYYRVGSSDYYLPDHTADVWLGGKNQYRVEINSLSGDSASVLVSDGLSVMNDPMDDDQEIQITRAGKPFYEVMVREPMAFLMAGPDAFDKFVEKDQPVVFVAAAAGEKAIELHSKDLGKVVINYRESSSPIPTRIDLFRAFRRRDAGADMDYPTSKESIKIVSSSRMPAAFFAVAPPKGKKIADEREKKSGPGGN